MLLFKDNQKLTIIMVSEMLLTTIRREIKLTRTVDGRQAYMARGNCKEYFLDLTSDMLVFDGWAIPVKLDSDTPRFIANGGFNFVTDKPEDLRKFIDKNNVNEKFCQHHKVMYVRPDDNQHTYRFVYPITS